MAAIAAKVEVFLDPRGLDVWIRTEGTTAGSAVVSSRLGLVAVVVGDGPTGTTWSSPTASKLRAIVDGLGSNGGDPLEVLAALGPGEEVEVVVMVWDADADTVALAAGDVPVATVPPVGAGGRRVEVVGDAVSVFELRSGASLAVLIGRSRCLLSPSAFRAEAISIG